MTVTTLRQKRRSVQRESRAQCRGEVTGSSECQNPSKCPVTTDCDEPKMCDSGQLYTVVTLILRTCKFDPVLTSQVKQASRHWPTACVSLLRDGEGHGWAASAIQ